MSHEGFSDGFAAGLMAADLPAGLVAPDGGDVVRRFAVYRNNVAHGLAEALKARFPVVARLVGDAFFAAMAQVFWRAHPPQSPVMQEWGAAFPGFLAGFGPVAHLRYLPDVARLEYARGVAYHAADAVALTHEEVQAALEQSVRLRLHPSVSLIRSNWPLVSIWAANQPGVEPGPMPQQAEAALVARRQDDEVIVERLTAGELAFCAELIPGATLDAGWQAAQMAVSGCEIAPVLARLIASGLLIGCREDSE